ncbi:tagaturonate epimerase family protein [Brooklawnia cerclae]|uniref:Tagaturonate/fructuronate epimerase n=1 Tax=Brooklawnia cerclae TaxID=349934 RepID=A0ABX0SFB0_9ACTN|nr:tagaturonate epimerase family protein [Brooklawnia cerclae]NIH57080.1 hypothetical protein [Brooklawnia cerclae]
MTIGKYSVGAGDRFGKEGVAQVAAFQAIKDAGVDVDIVWNKSNREHKTIGTTPADQRKAADDAVTASGWAGRYFVDADHINMSSVDAFVGHCDFFTLDVTDFIGKPASPESLAAFQARRSSLVGEIEVPGIADPLVITEDLLRAVAERYLYAVEEADRTYRHIKDVKGDAPIVVEVSMDETDKPQKPAELLIILAAVADAGIPIATIAPKFSGRFNKGVDYVGEVTDFLAEFRADVCVANYAVEAFGIPAGLKLSVHTGSDKFSIYPGIGDIIRELDAGLHLKTAGTTWLEELIGLAEAGGQGLDLAKEIYRSAYGRYDELAAPYSDVIDIDQAALPSPDTVEGWTSAQYAGALRHDQSNPAYDRNVRQLLHVAYKVAAEMGPRYLAALDEHREHVARNVTENLLERHLKPLFATR